jgi:DNA (cytosine-5)-methyltransferase 1
MNVLDLFCGMGGLASGFKKAGFSVEGVDISPHVKKIFALNEIGNARIADLSQTTVDGKFDLITGGPPCKPWSAINVTKRENKHEDYHLLARFFHHVKYHEPLLFLMENVPPVAKDRLTLSNLEDLKRKGYSIRGQVIRYSDYGAPVARHRFILVGIKGRDPEYFFKRLLSHKKPAKTVAQAIGHLSDKKYGEVPDHVYPGLRTIHKYRKYYETGKYGWYILEWGTPAPSFGNVMKTYILHPSSWNGSAPRVISIKEALLLMGFDENFIFPEKMGMGIRYQMVADAVSPVFAYAAACVIKEMIEGVDDELHNSR